ncbi:two-component system response regulator NarL [Colwellia sp. E150_009]|tara:strand:- start:2006 stop:2668 length:663 start_codon:yes stop_codon:yes gene_type:complete
MIKKEENKMQQANILLVDDHPMLRKGVAQLISIEDNLHVIGEVNSGDEAITFAVEHNPDLILLDLNMKGLSGIETLSALKRANVNSKVIIFSVSDNETDVLQALKFNADGYLLKDSEPEELIAKINHAIRGEFVISEPITQILARSLRPQQQTNILQTLTPRELENLKLIAGGKSNKEIARKLGITESTVKVHNKNLFKKLGLKSRVEAAMWAVAHEVNF